MIKEINGNFGKATLFTEPGNGIRVSMQDAIQIFGNVKGYISNLNRLRKDSDICIVEDEAGELVEVITLSNFIEAAVNTPDLDRSDFYDMIIAIEDAVVTC